MEYILLFMSVCVSVLYSSFSNVFSKKMMKNSSDFFLFNASVSLVGALVFLVLTIRDGNVSLFTFLFGIAFMAITFLSIFSNIQALKHGSMACTVMFGSCGMLIPAIAGVIFWKEDISILQIIAAFIIAISFVIGADLKHMEKVTLKWFGFAFALFIFAGLTGILQKMHQSSQHSDERFFMLFVAFINMSVVSYLIYLKSRKKDKEYINYLKITPAKAAVVSIVTGLCLSFVHPVNLYLSGVLPGIFFFPIINGSSTVLSGIVSVVVMKEKLKREQAISFIVGIIGIVLLSIG
ncbi:MAG: hypothetical protein ACOX3J_11750 [Clostridia bacterium]|jgi:drug/metabolite transporter (DMT)-like permease